MHSCTTFLSYLPCLHHLGPDPNGLDPLASFTCLQTDVGFLFTSRDDSLMGRVLAFAKMSDISEEEDGLMILDAPNQAVYK